MRARRVAMRNYVRRIALKAGQLVQRVRLRGVPRLLYVTGPFVIGNGLRVVDTVSGVKITADVRDYPSCMMIYGRYAPEVVTILKFLINLGDSVVDVGAHLGYITSNMATMVGPAGAVHSLEPDPQALMQVEMTIKANDHHWVRVFGLAAGDREGELRFTPLRHSAGLRRWHGPTTRTCRRSV